VLAEGVPERLPVLEVQLPSGGAIALDCRLVDGKDVGQLWGVASRRMENVRHNKTEATTVGQVANGPVSNSKLLGVGQHAQWWGQGGSGSSSAAQGTADSF